MIIQDSVKVVMMSPVLFVKFMMTDILKIRSANFIEKFNYRAVAALCLYYFSFVLISVNGWAWTNGILYRTYKGHFFRVSEI